MIEGLVGQQQILLQTITIVLIARFHWIIHCFVGAFSQNSTKCGSKSGELNMRIFRDKFKPSKRLFDPLADQAYLFTVGRVKDGRLHVCLINTWPYVRSKWNLI